MTEAGLIAQRTLPPPAPAVVYELTPLGRELEPVLLALGRFGARYLQTPKRGDRTHVRWAMVSLKRRYTGSPREGTLALAIDERHQFRLRMRGTQLEIEEGARARAGRRARGDDERDVSRAVVPGRLGARVDRRGRIALAGKAQTFFDLVAAVGAKAELAVRVFARMWRARGALRMRIFSCSVCQQLLFFENVSAAIAVMRSRIFRTTA